MEPDHVAQLASPRPRVLSVAMAVGIAVTAIGALWALVAAVVPAGAQGPTPPRPLAALELPAVELRGARAVDPCSDAAVQAALAAGDDAAVVAAFGGGEGFREAVIAGSAPCLHLDDPTRSWVVVNKARPLAPLDFAPAALESPGVQTTTASDLLRPDTAAALTDLAAAVDDAAGPIAMNNGYRSYRLQVATYSAYVQAEGQQSAERGSARPGFSEHQSGLAADVVACARGCGELDAFGDTAQSAWVQEHAWEYGFVVRYESGATERTGYMPEPWHLRYIGLDLARAYHAGGFHTLEEFFGLPAAPDYPH